MTINVIFFLVFCASEWDSINYWWGLRMAPKTKDPSCTTLTVSKELYMFISFDDDLAIQVSEWTE